MLPKTSFPRLKKTEVSMPIVEANHVEIATYVGPRKPPMPPFPEYEVDEEFSKMQSVSRTRAENLDFNFFFDISFRKDCPEYNGYCTRVNREQGYSLRPKTQIVYMPLLDMVPATTTTMQTSIKQAKLCLFSMARHFACIHLVSSYIRSL